MIDLFENATSEIMEHFERSVSSEGNLERMQNRVHILERALAHLMAFVAIHLRLTEAEIENEDGLTDF